MMFMKNIIIKIISMAVVIFFFVFSFAAFADAQISTVKDNLNKSTISSGAGKTSTPAVKSAVKPSAVSTSKSAAVAKTVSASSTKVIADDEFTDFNFMTVEELTALLVSMNSPMAEEYEGVKPADIIIEVAKENKVNPLVILATMQKENGLVQTKKKISKFKLDWAMGVGVYDNGKMNQAYKGFKKQITGAADTFRKNFDKGANLISAKKSTKLPINYGKDNFSPANAATYSLYSYTPHTHGAKLFASIYNSYKSKLAKVRASKTSAAASQTTKAPARISD